MRQTQIRERLLPERPVKKQTPSSAVLKAENITKDFGRLRALDHVSFEIQKREIVGLLGPNGAGKTTAVRILTGFFPPSQGKVWLAGEELFENPKAMKRRIGYLPESVSLYPDMRVQEFLDFVAGVKSVPANKQKAHLEEIVSRCGLWDVRRRMIGYLSKGFRQRVGLAQAIVGDPHILVFDEPTNGLDPKQIVEIRSLIREIGKERTVLLCTHILPEVSAVCDRVLILNRGRVVASGTAEELEQGLNNRRNVFVTIGDTAKKEEALALFKTVPGVENAAIFEEKPDQTTFSLDVSSENDVRPEISRLCVSRQLPLLEIRSGHLSLEEIFMKVIVREEPAPISL